MCAPVSVCLCVFCSRNFFLSLRTSFFLLLYHKKQFKKKPKKKRNTKNYGESRFPFSFAVSIIFRWSHNRIARLHYLEHIFRDGATFTIKNVPPIIFCVFNYSSEIPHSVVQTELHILFSFTRVVVYFFCSARECLGER